MNPLSGKAAVEISAIRRYTAIVLLLYDIGLERTGCGGGLSDPLEKDGDVETQKLPFETAIPDRTSGKADSSSWKRTGNPAAVKILERLQERLKSKDCMVSCTGDWKDARNITYPPEIGELIELGSDGVRTVMNFIRDGSRFESSYDFLLVGVLVAVGGIEARRFLESLLVDTALFSSAADGLKRLGDTEALNALARHVPRNESERIEVLSARLRLGDESVIAELIRIGLTTPDESYDVASELCYLPELRKYLGFNNDDYDWVFDNDKFMLAADEWYHTEVLHKPSPYQSPAEPCFQEPFKREKEMAWKELYSRCVANTHPKVRILPADPSPSESDSRSRLFLVEGYWQARITLYIFLPEQDGARIWILSSYSPDRRPGHQYDDSFAMKAEHAFLPMPLYAGVLVGLRTVLQSKMIVWWDGPGLVGSTGGRPLVVQIEGLEEISNVEPLGFEGCYRRAASLLSARASRVV